MGRVGKRASRETADTSAQPIRAQGSRDLTVVFIPDWRSINPYQDLLAAALERRGIRVRFPDQFAQSRPLLTALLSRQFDILHLHWTQPYIAAETLPGTVLRSVAFLLKVSLARLLRRRIIWTVHNLVSHEARFGRWERRVNWLLARLTHTLVVHYPGARQIVRKSYRVPARKEILVAHHGHYMEAYGEASGIRADGPHHESTHEPLMVLAFGLVRRYKRLEDLIMAFRDLDREDVRLTIKGSVHDKEYADELRRLARGYDRIALELEFVDDRKVGEVFAAADIVAVTQADTLTSGSLILAMSLGKPIVCARGPHAEFLIGEGNESGVLYTPESIAELTKALGEIADRRHELPEMGLANRRRIAPYTWLGMAEELERAYLGTD